MKIGTKSVLFGAHCFFIHPWFVALGWWKLYSFPWNPRLWIAFFIHDLGYFGKPNMDGPEGEQHPEFAANIMFRLFGYRWYLFVLLHSRYYTKLYPALRPSELCWADKMAIALTPWWLYVPMAVATGEIYEYQRAQAAGYRDFGLPGSFTTWRDHKRWFRALQFNMRQVAHEQIRASPTEEDHSLDQTEGRSGASPQRDDSGRP